MKIYWFFKQKSTFSKFFRLAGLHSDKQSMTFLNLFFPQLDTFKETNSSNKHSTPRIKPRNFLLKNSTAVPGMISFGGVQFPRDLSPICSKPGRLSIFYIWHVIKEKWITLTTVDKEAFRHVVYRQSFQIYLFLFMDLYKNLGYIFSKTCLFVSLVLCSKM